MVTEPVFFPATRPVADTVAMEVFELDQENFWSETVFPKSSLAVAESCIVDLCFSRVDGAETVTVATGRGETVTVAVLDLPSLAAVIAAVPTAAPVTSPEAFTVATAA